MNDKETVKKRIEEWVDIKSKIQDKTTKAYLDMLNSMRYDYELLKDETNCVKICLEIEQCILFNKYEEDVSKILLASYDSRARCGDFRAYCIALEWLRPIEKQFFLPRRRILEKHGVMQAFQDMQDDKLDFLCLNLPPRVGKKVSNDTPILTKKGWKTHGELKVGDYVLNDKGRFVMVQAVSDEEDALCDYEIAFSNGEKITTHLKHEWVVYDRHSGNYKIVETKDMIGKLRDNYDNKPTKNHYRFSVPLIEPILGEYKELPVAPYSLGAWLGDGTHSTPVVTIDKKDNDIVCGMETEGYSISNLYIHKTYGTYRYSFRNLRNDLQKIGLCHSRKQNIKYIPDVYFTASLQQRLELLAGLLDTDGTLSKKEHRYHFSTTSVQLKEDFVKLISTFGWRCSVSEYEPKLSTSGIQGKKKVYSVGFNPTIHIPCRLERKQLNEFSKQRRITITNIEPTKEPKKGHCIQVEGGIYLAGKTMIPTHNSTLSLFFLTFRAGQFPGRSILGSGHSTALTQAFYNEFLNIVTSDEYRFGSIFPKCKIVNKSSEYTFVDFNNPKRFHTMTFRSIDAGTTGLVEASNLLYCDDLVKDVETANNPDRLEKLFYNYTSSIQDRKVQRKCKDGVYRPCPELHVNTPWSVNDVTNRLIRIYSEDGTNDRVRVISVPCYDENGESNFEYDYGKGFDANYYNQLEKAEDPVIFSAKYLMKCIEREGHPFTKDQLTFYSELPEEEPDWVVAYADVAHGGEDYFSFPIGYVYGDEVYIEDVLFVNKLDVTKTRPLVCDKIMQHNVTRAGFEENNGGKLYADWIVEDLKRRKYRCNITTHKVPTSKSKLDRIMSCQSEIKGIATENGTYKIYFKSDKLVEGNRQYMDFMRITYQWSQKVGSIQKTQHDDSLDSISGMITNVLGGKPTTGRASSKIPLSKLGL